MNNRRLLLGVTFVLFGLLALYGAVGIFSRPAVDDFCLAALVDSQGGIIPAVSYQYWNWSGNVIGLYYQVVGAVLGLHTIGPLALLTVWCAAFAWFFWEFSALVGVPRSRLLVTVIGALLTLTLIDMSPNIGQTLYWWNGTANYGPTTAVFILLLALLVRVARVGARRIHLIAATLLAFTAVLGQITMAVYCVGILLPLLVVVAAWRQLPQRRGLLWTVGIALGAALGGAAIVVLTPGNDVRQAALINDHVTKFSMIAGIIINLKYASFMFFASILFSLLSHVLLAVIGFLAAQFIRPVALQSVKLSSTWRRIALYSGLGFGFCLFYLGNFASIYTLGTEGPPRAWVPPQALWAILVLLVGYSQGLGKLPAPDIPRVVRQVLVCIAIFCVVQMVNLISIVPSYQKFAEDTDDRLAAMQNAVAQGQRQVAVPAFRVPVAQLLYLDESDELSCLSAYYKLENLTVVPRETQ